ncbi:MAG: DUF308 domain-containing protein [Synergistaceae bacterium]|nr:DUF308 domain-containing protein [Synergistaceae bacterium]
MENKTPELSDGMKVLNVVTSLLVIAIGVYLVFVPRLIVLLFSAAVFTYGIQLIIMYLSMKDKRSGWDIIAGITNLLFGAIMLFGSPEARIMGVLTMEVFIAVWALCIGFSHICGSFGLKRLGVKNWYWILVRGIFTVICGFVFLSMPIISAMGLVFVIGVYTGAMFILSGITGLMGVLSGKKAAN